MVPKRYKASIFSLVLAATASGCDQTTPTGPLSPNAMWYRFEWSADYAGKRINIEQYVACGLTEPKQEGFPGAVPAYQLRKQQPESVAAQLADGSRVYVRIPDLCLYNRAYRWPDQSKAGNDPANQNLGRQPGWKSRGPFDIFPVVAWQDRPTSPTKLEAYYARAYYENPQARFANVSSRVEFMPLGYRPPEGADILKLESPEPYYEDESKSEWVALAIVPVADPVKLSGMKAVYQAYRDPQRSTGDYDIYTGAGEPVTDDSLDSQTFFAADIRRCLALLLSGRPGESSFPFDNADWGSEWPDEVRRSGGQFHTKENFDLLERRQQRSQNCYEKLGSMRSLAVKDGVLSVTQAPPGAVIFSRWNDLYPAMQQPDRSRFDRRMIDLEFRVSLDGARVPYLYRKNDGVVKSKISGVSYAPLYLTHPYSVRTYGTWESF